MMGNYRAQRLFAAAFFLCASILFVVRSTNAQSNHENILEEAWLRTERVGGYEFATELTEITHPSPSITSLGRPAHHETIYIEGVADRRSGTLELSLWDDPAVVPDSAEALEIRIDGATAQGRVAGGEWQTIDDVSGPFAPAGDAAAFLASAKHVRPLGPDSLDVPQADGGTRSVDFQRYAFVLDGEQYAENMRAMLQEQMRESGELPPGINLSSSDYFRNAVGGGEAWLDGNGMPLRIALDIEFPQDAIGERTFLEVQTDFVQYQDASAVQRVAFLDNPINWIAGQLPPAPSTAAVAQTATITSIIGLLFVAVWYRPKETYKTASVFIAAQLAFSPLIYVVEADRMRSLHDLFPAPELAAETGPTAAQLAALKTNTTPFNPAVSPLDAGKQVYEQAQAAEELLAQIPQPGDTSAERAPTNASNDLDGDGLTATEEALWGSVDTNADNDGDGLSDGAEVALCPVRVSPSGPSWADTTNWTDVACPYPYLADTDGDQLTDAEEVLYLGTYPHAVDSDYDGISDYNEVHGYLLAIDGQRYYTDPLNPDSDGDGLLDGVECPSLADASPWTAATTCKNTNNKPQADVHSLDNDGDGVPNNSDLSPYTQFRPSGDFSSSNPLELNLDDISAHRPTLVDIQIRPTNEQHLSYALNVLDWPTGDTDGQIQRYVNETFGDQTDGTPLNDPAFNGDMRLSPMLEIRLPGNSQDLPRTTARQVVQLTDAGQTVALATLKKVDDSSSSLTLTTLGSDSADVHILSGSCNNGNSVFSQTGVSEGFSTTFSDKKLGAYANGSHSLRVVVGADQFCEPIGKMVKDQETVAVHLQKRGSEIGTLELVASSSTTAATLRLIDTTAQYDVKFMNGSCGDFTSKHSQAPGIGHEQTMAIPEALTAFVNGQRAVVLQQGDKAISCSSLGNIVSGSLDTMVDAEELAPYQISVHEDINGDLIAMTPLTLQEDPVTGERIAFNGKMLYYRLASGSIASTVNLVWLVTVLTDSCPQNDCSKGATNISQVVHSYRDESWYLTGLDVQEQAGMNVAVVHENPASDFNTAGSDVANRNLEFDDNLWWLARGLNRSFISGRDENSDDVRDIDIYEIDARWDTDTANLYNDSQRWGLRADAFQVHRFWYSRQSDLSQLNGTEIPNILNNAFGNGSFNVTSVDGQPTTQVAPTLLIAREETVISLGLDDSADPNTSHLVTKSGHALTVNIDSSVDPVVVASMSWKPFRYNDTLAKWETYPIVEYVERMEKLLPAAADFASEIPADATNAEADAAYEQIGSMVMAKNAYLYYWSGVSKAVAIGNQLTFEVDNEDSPTDEDLEGEAAFAIDRGVEVGGLMAAYMGELLVPLSAEYNRYMRIQSKPVKRLVAARDITLKGAIGRAHTKAWAAVTEDLRENFSTARGHGLRGKLNTAGGVAVTGGSIMMGVASSFFDPQSNNSSEKAVGLSLSGIETGSSIMESVQTFKAYKSWKLFRPDKAFTVTKFAQTLKATKAAKIAAAVGLALEVGIAFGVFLYQILSAGVKAGSLAFNEALAGLVGTLVVAVLLAALATTGVGAIVVAIIAIFDGLVALICGLAPPDEESDDVEDKVYSFFCKGLSGLMAELVAFVLYDQTDIINVNSGDRIQFLSFNPYLQNAKAGFVPDAPLTVELNIRNRVHRQEPNGLGVTWAWQFSPENVRRAAFIYDVVNAPVNDEDDQLHNDTWMGRHRSEWQYIGSKDYVIERFVSDSAEITLPEFGINQSVDAYFAEGYQSPTQECIIGIYPSCWIRANAKSNYNNLNIVFDVFPPTLTEFYTLEQKDGGYALAWDQLGDVTFPRLLDADGDGLTYLVDPDDSRRDKDGDGIDDARELQLGTNPLLDDSDQDGVLDGDELKNGTNPTQADSDSDGLNDGDERAGWEITYNAVGDTTWVVSNPLSADADNDQIFDRREKALGFSPNVPSDPTVLAYETDIIETLAPAVILPFDELANTEHFADVATLNSFLNASCTGSFCPVSGISGRVGNGVAFNGSDQFLTLGPVDAISAKTNDLNIAAWVKLNKTDGVQTILGTSGYLNDDGFAFSIEGDELRFDYFVPHTDPNPQDYTAKTTDANLPIDEWVHVAAMAFVMNSSQLIRIVLYVNGTTVSTTDIPYTLGNLPVTTIDDLMVGARYQHNMYASEGERPEVEPYVSINHLDGIIDELVVFNNTGALTFAEIEAQVDSTMRRQYNTNDGIMIPSQTFAFETSLRNKLLGRNVEGVLTTHSPSILSGLYRDTHYENFFLGPNSGNAAQDSQLTQQVDFTVDSNAPTGRYVITQTAGAIVDVPTEPIPGQFAETVFWGEAERSFDGQQHQVRMDPSYALNGTDFTIAMWLRPTDISGRRGVLGWDSGQHQTATYNSDLLPDDGYPSLQIVDGKISFGFGSNGTWQTADSSGVYLSEGSSQSNNWTHVAIVFDKDTSKAKLYVDGQNVETFTYTGNPTNDLGNFNLGRSTNIGRIDFGNVNIRCEEDGGRPHFDIVGYTPTNATKQFNIWSNNITEGDTENINRSVVFREYMDFAMCENDSDDSSHASCDSDDDFMGRKRFPFFADEVTVTRGLFSTTPSDSTCEWYEGYDDWAYLDYAFSRDSVPYEGSIKDIRIIKRELTTQEVDDLRLSNDIIARFKFNDRPGAEVFEDDVAATYARCFFSSPTCPVTGVEGREGTAVYLNGDDVPPNGPDGVNVFGVNGLIREYLTQPSSTGFSFGGWIKPDSTANAGQRMLLSFTNFFGGGDGMILGIQPSGGSPGAYSTFTVNYVDQNAYNPSNQFAYDQWHHLFVTVAKSGATNLVKIYMNGVEIHSHSSTTLPEDPGYMTIGGHIALGGYFKGAIDDVYIGKGAPNASGVVDIMRGVPVNRQLLDEDGVESTTSVHLDGQIGESKAFDSDADVVWLEPAENLGVWDDDFTFTAWVRGTDFVQPGQADTYRAIIGSPWHNVDLWYFGLHNGKPFVSWDQDHQGTFGTPQTWTLEADRAIPPDQWTHLGVRRTGSTVELFVNGTSVKSGTFNGFSGFGGAVVGLGQGLTKQPNGSGHWLGRIDEAANYKRALSDEEMVRLYNFQVTWLDEDRYAPFAVDADVPTGTLQTLPAFMPKLAQQVLINGYGTGSQAASARLYGIHVGSNATSSDSYGVPCLDADGEAAFCALFDPPIEGRYQLDYEVIDQVGHIGTRTVGGHTVVDDSAPNLTLSELPSTPFKPTLSTSQAALWTIVISGTVADGDIVYDSGGVMGPGSGVATVDVSLLDANGEPVGEPSTQPAAINGTSWRVEYAIRASDPTGSYSGQIVATDNVGKQAILAMPSFMIDATPPEAEMTGSTAETITVGSGRSAATLPKQFNANDTISGVVNDTSGVSQPTDAGVSNVQIGVEPRFQHGSPFVNQTLPSGTTFFLPLDLSGASETVSDTTFTDIAQGVTVSCSADSDRCPQSGMHSRNGQALQFDGVDDRLSQAYQANVTGLTTDFTVAAWIKPASLPGSPGALIIGNDNSADRDGYNFGVENDQIMLNLQGVQKHLTTLAALEPSVWTHVAANLKPNHDVDFYKNGVLIETSSGSSPAIADTNGDNLIIGGDSGTFYIGRFHGGIDDVFVMQGTPAAADWSAIMGLAPTVHLTFDDPLVSGSSILADEAGMGADVAFEVSPVADKETNFGRPGIVGSGSVYMNGTSNIMISDTVGILPHDAPFSISLWLQDADAFGIYFGHMVFESYGFDDTLAFYWAPGPHTCTMQIGDEAGAHHLAITADGVNPMKVYWDGEDVSLNCPVITSTGPVTNIYVGSGSVGALLDDLRIYQRALPSNEVAALAALQWNDATVANRSFTTADAPVAIPDDESLTDACQVISVSGVGSADLSEVRVDMTLNHTYAGDLDIDLITPSGSRHGLIPANTTSAGFVNTHPIHIHTGAARAASTLGQGIFYGSAVCRDDGACNFAPHDTLSGSAAADGMWRLCTNDAVAGDDGTLESWTIRFATPAEWSGGFAEGLEGFYDLEIRASDALGNTDGENRPEWSGIIDTLKPRVVITPTTSRSAASTYQVVIDDFNLDDNSIRFPPACDSNITVNARETYQSPWYQAFEEQAGALEERVVHLDMTCTVPTQLNNNARIVVCDTVGNCETYAPDGSITPTAVSLSAAETSLVNGRWLMLTFAILLTTATAWLHSRRRRKQT